MNTVILENNVFIHVNQGQKTVLLDCNDFLSNKSRIPMHRVGGDALTIPQLIVGLLNKNEELLEQDEAVSLASATLLLDSLTAGFLCKTALPVKVLEIGSVDGLISYHLASLLGAFNQESFLCCVNDSIGNASEYQLLDRIVLVEKAPGFSFLAADYHNTHLQENEFDLIVINGTVNFAEPYQVVLEAQRLAKNHGLVICYSTDGQLLESSFKTIFSERKEYQLSEVVSIMTAVSDKIYKTDDGDGKVICKFVKQAEQVISANGEIDIKQYLSKIEEYLEEAIENRDIESKIRLIDLKETLINHLLFKMKM